MSECLRGLYRSTPPAPLLLQVLQHPGHQLDRRAHFVVAHPRRLEFGPGMQQE